MYVAVETTKGSRMMQYTSGTTDKGISSSGTYIHHGLGTQSRDGTWQTFTRDLEADLQEFESDNSIISVNGFLVKGSGRVDDVKLQRTNTQTYTYDSNGNRLSSTINSITTTATYTLDDSLEVYGDNTYRYNDDGYLMEKITPHERVTYSYNTLGALQEVNTIKVHSNNWEVYDDSPQGATISNVYDEDKQSYVMEFDGDGFNNGYRIGHNIATSPRAWNNTDHKSIRWSMNFNEVYYMYVAVETTKGSRMMQYTSGTTDKGISSSGTYIHHGLGTDSRDGTWQTFTRDLRADLKEYESDNELISINGFLIKGSGRVDDITTISADSQTTVYEDAQQEKNTQIIYHLNALNQRVAKEVDGEVVEKYLWKDLTTLLAVYDSNNTLVQRFEYADLRMPISMMQDGKKYYLHYDQVGSLRAVSNAEHNIVKEVIYDTFGNILSDTNPEFNMPFGFAGGLHDRDTSLVHFGYREYDPYTGKWTAKDPIGFDGGDSNLYGYVLGDPVNFIDPEGLKIAVSGSTGFGTGIHVGIAGANYHYSIKTINGKVYKIHTVCGRIGLGMYFGVGIELSTGVEDDCQSTGWSGGLGGDAAYGTVGAGASASGNTSGASVSTGLRIPNTSIGLGASVGLDGCYSWVTPL